ncbi:MULTISPECIES: flagellar export protein FliJ [Bacillaceae]|uniref:Flagellar FliJ protein n=1 Tax=Evansella alkalicola TaxID=745819 RepID=A0ABS6JP54_9BACI|nr:MULTISPECIES: flagellar export protein FliJ [Bacillaceae]MBU9720320.1 flagellar export protein FliJ [Bacillus alkalicola]
MSFQFTLQKVLEMKEHNKMEAQLEYQDAMRKFEEVATELYHVLKKKEEILQTYEENIGKGVPISIIQQTEEALRFLQLQIDRLQESTHYARSSMNEKQQLLLTSTVDLKKYEKMKEKKFQQYEVEQKRFENKNLDEVSVQQYMNR